MKTIGHTSMKICRTTQHSAGKFRHVKQLLKISELEFLYTIAHGLRTPNEGINQRYLKNGAEVADKICFGRT